MKRVEIGDVKDGVFYKTLELVSANLNSGGVCIIPTDSLYCFCSVLNNKKGIEKIAKIKGVKSNKANFSIIIPDLSSLNEYVKPFSRSIFKILYKNLPGAFTFILIANNFIPKLFNFKRKEIGVRMPENDFTKELLKRINVPLVVSSVFSSEEIIESYNDPCNIENNFKNQVDILVDQGIREVYGSTIVDCRTDEISIIRQGVGVLEI